MPTIHEGNLSFSFPGTWEAGKYDNWSFYRKQFQSVGGGTKAIDILAISPSHNAWFIEVKDYRLHPRTKVIELADEVATKVRDSLAGIFSAKVNANDIREKSLATKAVNATKIRIVLHLEQPAINSILFPRAIDPAKIKQKLKQILKAVDAHPLVLERSFPGTVEWTVTASR